MPRKNPPKLTKDIKKEQPTQIDPGMLKGRNPKVNLPPLFLPPLKIEPPEELGKLNKQHQEHLDRQKDLAKRLLAASGSSPLLNVPVNQRNLTPSGQARARGAIPADAVGIPVKKAEQPNKRQPELTKIENKSKSPIPPPSKQGPTKAFPIQKRALSPTGQARVSGAVPAKATTAKLSADAMKQKEKHPTLEKLKSKVSTKKSATKTPMPSPRASASRPASAKSSGVGYGTIDTSRVRGKRPQTPPATPRLFSSDEPRSPRDNKQAPKKEKAKKMRSRSAGFKMGSKD